MHVKHHRRGPAIVLGFAVAASLGVMTAARLAAAAREGAGAPTLEERQRAVASPDADADAWLLYARALQQAGRGEHAAQAFARAVSLDPYLADARLGLALCLADLGDGEALMAALTDLVLSDAVLALQVLQRSELARHASLPGFGELLVEARSQAID